MGSLTSRPKAVTSRVAATTTTTTTATTNNPSSSTDVPVTTPDPQEVAKQRAENVLRRSRSTLGNILTSFRGILSSSNAAPTRKNLLGE